MRQADGSEGLVQALTICVEDWLNRRPPSSSLRGPASQPKASRFFTEVKQREPQEYWKGLKMSVRDQEMPMVSCLVAVTLR
ncbi:hypothetical protein SUGI_0968210 [Cryptomeria japonica]|nr:hypothetical protein SUGI_0968210 [Cryptomeria japonica]